MSHLRWLENGVTERGVEHSSVCTSLHCMHTITHLYRAFKVKALPLDVDVDDASLVSLREHHRFFVWVSTLRINILNIWSGSSGAESLGE